VLVLLALAACGRSASELERGEPSAAELERGRAIATSLKQTLLRELTAAMNRGLPSAIEVCNVKAPAIAAELARDGASVGRATRRPRNPSNRATGWNADALTSFEAAQARGESLATARFSRRLPDGRIAYAEPLVIQELCVNCHGKVLAPDVTAALATRYPDDQATGYAVGDLRGVLWVELP
jgi:hypothetical protein